MVSRSSELPKEYSSSDGAALATTIVCVVGDRSPSISSPSSFWTVCTVTSCVMVLADSSFIISSTASSAGASNSVSAPWTAKVMTSHVAHANDANPNLVESALKEQLRSVFLMVTMVKD
ncbi:hypothetical protein ACHAWU_005090 [Discostella pseudostelligera]|uniref:Uncharacterized protein n=1 Tax=Discostella pseudostelligera TaxID=259834 RepID=A0ABD3MK16_9STRA